MIATVGTRSAYGVFFKPLQSEFGWNRATTSGAFSLSMVMEGIAGAFMGGLNDRLGPRKVLTFCCILLGAGYLLMSKIGSIWQLYVLYGLVAGIGMSGSFVPLLSTVTRWFKTRRAIMTGIVAAGVGIGAIITPLVTNWLISLYDWRTSYLILGGVVLVICVCAAQFLKRDPSQIGQLPYGENKGSGLVLNRDAEGYTLREATRTRQLWLLIAMFLCSGFCSVTPMVHFVPHATDIGFSSATAANMLAVMGGASIAGNIVMGAVADKIGSRQVFIFSFIVMAVLILWLTSVAQAGMLYLFAAVFGFIMGGMYAVEAPLVAWLFGLKSHGLIYGINGIALTTGAAIGPFMAGYIFDVTASYHTAFLVCAAISIVGLVLMVLIRPTSKPGALPA